MEVRAQLLDDEERRSVSNEHLYSDGGKGA